ncbi:hypothetical protein HBB16_08205 [Pseudonocardia sp. MCCB 268]|nr:hypothetical protein [Pseudonocardia cytotoxica]
MIESGLTASRSARTSAPRTTSAPTRPTPDDLTHPGMSTWYRNAAGRVVTNTPWRLIDYWYYDQGAGPGRVPRRLRERIGAVS